MHTSWDCFALVVIEGALTKEILCYRGLRDPIALGEWRLPGGPRKAGETDFIQTLRQAVRSQTGIDIRKGKETRRIRSTKARIHSGRKRNGSRKLTHTERFYLVTITPDRFLDEFKGSLSSDGWDCEFKSVESIIRSDFFLPEHREVVRAHFNL